MLCRGGQPVAGRVVVVTGASAGIGRAVACAFGAKGDRVGLLARGEVGLDGVVKDIERAGGQALAVPTDVADHGQVEAAAEQVEQTLGPIDIWVNVAFTSVFAPFTQIRPEEFKRVTEVSYLGYVYGTRAALDRMLARDHGTIVQVGSALAYRGIPLQSAYCGAKHAIQGFTEALRCELLHQNSRVRITMVQLPAVNTPQFDWVLNRLPNRPRPVAPVYQPGVADWTPVVGPPAMRVGGGWRSRSWRSRSGSDSPGRCEAGWCCTRSASPRPAPGPRAD